MKKVLFIIMVGIMFFAANVSYAACPNDYKKTKITQVAVQANGNVYIYFEDDLATCSLVKYENSAETGPTGSVVKGNIYSDKVIERVLSVAMSAYLSGKKVHVYFEEVTGSQNRFRITTLKIVN